MSGDSLASGSRAFSQLGLGLALPAHWPGVHPLVILAFSPKAQLLLFSLEHLLKDSWPPWGRAGNDTHNWVISAVRRTRRDAEKIRGGPNQSAGSLGQWSGKASQGR